MCLRRTPFIFQLLWTQHNVYMTLHLHTCTYICKHHYIRMQHRVPNQQELINMCACVRVFVCMYIRRLSTSFFRYLIYIFVNIWKYKDSVIYKIQWTSVIYLWIVDKTSSWLFRLPHAPIRVEVLLQIHVVNKLHFSCAQRNSCLNLAEYNEVLNAQPTACSPGN